MAAVQTPVTTTTRTVRGMLHVAARTSAPQSYTAYTTVDGTDYTAGTPTPEDMPGTVLIVAVANLTADIRYVAVVKSH